MSIPRQLPSLKSEYDYCAQCERRTLHLTEVDGWRCCSVCGTTEWGEG